MHVRGFSSHSWRSINRTLVFRVQVTRNLVDDPSQAKLFLSPPLIDMADQRPPQTSKGSKGFRNRLKKVFGRGSQSTPPSRSNSPPAVVAPPAVVTSPPTVAVPPAVSVPPAGPLPPADLAPPTVAVPPAVSVPPADPLPPSQYSYNTPYKMEE